MRILLATLLLFAPALGEDGKDPKEGEDKAPKKVEPGSIEQGEPAVPIEDSSSARRQVARFEKEWDDAETREERLEALDRLGKWDHRVVLKAARKHVDHRDYFLATKATIVCARQKSSKDRAARVLLRVLKREKRTNVVCAAMIGLGWLGYDKRAAIREAENLFRKDFKELHKAATRYFGYIRYKPAFRMLAERLDEPAPADPNSPTNPPASYWRERWFAWKENVKYTRWALAQMVPGETFDVTEEAKQWAENHGREHGIEW